MPWLKHTSGEPAELHNQQVLGDESPLAFDDDGYVEVDDFETVEKLLAMHRHVERGGHGPEMDEEEEESVEEAEEADTCDAVKEDGEVCGRELPCPYHTDNE